MEWFGCGTGMINGTHFFTLTLSCLSFRVQLPYYIDGDRKITQSNAIFRYLGRKYDMCELTAKYYKTGFLQTISGASADVFYW